MLPNSDWLDQAQRLPVGMKIRVKHGRERRANMVIANERDRWWAYCQACKEGGNIHKEHVLLGADLQVQENQVLVPRDLIACEGSDYEAAVGKFLASKSMMFPYLPKVYVSPTVKRMFIQDELGQWHGRDLTGHSNAKWLHYGAFLSGVVGPITVVTEDIFSKYKIRYALRNFPQYNVVSTLGASCGGHAALAMKDSKLIIWAYDADKAGDDGFKQASTRMRAFGSKQVRFRPPEGLDPKDMFCADIRSLIRRCYESRT